MKANQKKTIADRSWKLWTWAQDTHVGEEQEFHKLFSVPREGVLLGYVPLSGEEGINGFLMLLLLASVN